MNKSYLLIFVRKLKTFLKNFQIQNLYVYVSNHLVLNKEVASQFDLVYPVGNKALRIEYTVVQDTENPEIEYEGALIKINNDLNYVSLTYDELYALYTTLDKLNFEDLSLQLISISSLCNKMPTTELAKIEQPQIDEPVQVQRGFNIKMNSSTIPKL